MVLFLDAQGSLTAVEALAHPLGGEDGKNRRRDYSFGSGLDVERRATSLERLWRAEVVGYWLDVRPSYCLVVDVEGWEP